MVIAHFIGLLALLASPEIPDETRADADLNDVCFVDASNGYAVGDRGLILQTNDAGRSWRRLESGVTCPLNAVQFIDSKHGWVVGGWTQPHTLRTFGVVLRTSDGGETWERLRKFPLPKLTDVKFADAKNGWAVGVGSAMFPSGVFRTRDGGSSWSSVAGQAGDWLAADFAAGSAAVVGRNTTFADVDRAQLTRRRLPAGRTGRRLALRDVQFHGASGWIVGDGGAILKSADHGRSWRTAATVIPDDIRRLFDAAAVAVQDQQVWVVGAPGSCVLYSPDAGVHWRVQPTGTTLPLYSIQFINATHGWAVGALGVVVHTQNGGASWKVIRAPDRRAAYIAVGPRNDQLPLEFIARYSGNDGYFGVARTLFDAPEVNTARVSVDDRTVEAVASLGGSVDRSVAFVSSPAVLQLPEKSVAQFAGGEEAMVERCVCLLRQWRPSVVVIGGDENDPQSRVAARVMLSAIAKAKDDEAYLAMQRSLKLPPHTVDKVLQQESEDRRGDIQLTSAEILARFGISIGDAVARANSIMVPQARGGDFQTKYRLVSSESILTAARHDAFSGLNIAPDGIARRVEGRALAANLASLRKLANKRRNAEALLEYAGGSGSIIAEISTLTRGLPEEAAGNLLIDLADDYYQQGKIDLALDVRQLFLKQFPHHPRADAIRIWMLQYGSSSEAWLLMTKRMAPTNSANIARRSEQNVKSAVATQIISPATTPDDKGVKLIDSIREQTQSAGVATVGAVEEVEPIHDNNMRKLAVRFGEGFSRTNLVLQSRGEVMFPLAAAYRQLKRTDDADRLIRRLGAGDASQTYTRMAWAEKWLVEPQNHSRPAVLICRSTKEKPHLDGRFDDACWSESQSVSLTTPAGDATDWPAGMMVAHDDEFLYLAVSCRKAPATVYATTEAKRSRDPLLTSQDRLHWSLDIDRDYTTYWNFTFDHRGFVAEDFFGDRSWNPTMYVASRTEGGYWSIEAAIPFAEITTTPPKKGDVWATKARRIAPATGAQEWQYPGGLLKFE